MKINTKYIKPFLAIAFLLFACNIFAPTNVLKPAFKINKPVAAKKAKPIRKLFSFGRNEIPKYSSLEYKERFKILNKNTKIKLQYNEFVEVYIHEYTKSKVKRRQLSQIIGKSKAYFPMFEKILKEKGLPKELKYLPVIESALTEDAVSRSGAVGLWQFMIPSAKEQGLVINDKVDERLNPYKSTLAAATYLKKLHNMFGSWPLAIAAYNCGQGTVLNAMKASGKKDFWELRPYLPEQTQKYVPAFMAYMYAMNYAAEHNLDPRT